VITNTCQGLDDGIVAPGDNGVDVLLLVDAGHQAVPENAYPHLFDVLELIQDLREELVVVLALVGEVVKRLFLPPRHQPLRARS